MLLTVLTPHAPSLDLPTGKAKGRTRLAETHASDPQLWRKPRVAARPYRHLLPLNLRMTRDPCHIFEDFIKPAHDPAANAQSEGEYREGEFLNQSKVGRPGDPLIGAIGLTPGVQEPGANQAGQ